MQFNPIELTGTPRSGDDIRYGGEGVISISIWNQRGKKDLLYWVCVSVCFAPPTFHFRFHLFFSLFLFLAPDESSVWIPPYFIQPPPAWFPTVYIIKRPRGEVVNPNWIMKFPELLSFILSSRYGYQLGKLINASCFMYVIHGMARGWWRGKMEHWILNPPTSLKPLISQDFVPSIPPSTVKRPLNQIGPISPLKKANSLSPSKRCLSRF